MYICNTYSPFMCFQRFGLNTETSLAVFVDPETPNMPQ